MAEKRINIIYTLNDKFVPQVAAGICSVCENNKSAKITFYLISDGITEQNQQKLRDFVKTYGQDANIIEIGDLSKYIDFDFDTTGWNSIVLARLVLDKLLPNTVDRILYLDGDTIVRGDLRDLYDIDMGKSVIGASIEPTASRKHKAALDIEGLYYNAGVLLIDLKKWRKEKTGQRILDYYAEHGGKLFANDQDAINGALKGEIYTLAPKYNFCNIYMQYPYRYLKKLVAPTEYFSPTEFEDSIKNPVIIHYLGEERPWRESNTHKYRADYKKYLAMTPWKDTPDDTGWNTYFLCWRIFNTITKPFPALRYKIIDSLIPIVLKLRARQNKQVENTLRGGVKCLYLGRRISFETGDNTMLKPKVSILIPAYNAEKLVHKAIDSALVQTYDNIEVIVINDGSTDDTWRVLQKCQKQYPQKVRIFSQKNKGLGATRNVLLEKAKGDYVVNLDADDWLKPDYVEVMLSALGEGDIAICGFERYDAQYQFRDKRVPELTSYTKYRFCTTAGKMFRRRFLQDNKLHYRALNMGEDAFFNVSAYAKTDEIAIVDYTGYCCYESGSSMAHSAKYSEAKSFYSVMKALVKDLNDSKMLYDAEFQFYVLKNLLMDVFLYKDGLSARKLIEIYRRHIVWYKEFLRQNRAKFKVYFQKGETLPINLTLNAFVVLTKLRLDGVMLRILKKIPVNIL